MAGVVLKFVNVRRATAKGSTKTIIMENTTIVFEIVEDAVMDSKTSLCHREDLI